MHRTAAAGTAPRLSLAILAFATLMLNGAGCGSREDHREVNLERTEPLPGYAGAGEREGALRVALGGIITPDEGLIYYRELLQYLARRFGTPIRAVDKESHAEVNRLLREGLVDFAFIGSGPYVDAHDEFGLELLAAPEAYGKTVYHSYLIVSRDSPARSLADLRGTSFTCTDPLSNTGNLVPSYMLARMGETKESFFRTCGYAYGHDKSIKAVAQGIVDGAAVDNLIWEYYRRIDPETVNRTRVLEVSPAYAIPPVVVRPGLDPELKGRLSKLFLNAHLDPEGKRILDGMGIDRFVEIGDDAYASIREMKIWLAANQPKS